MTLSSNKIFIIGLPRTGTTSICSKFLSLSFRVAHTAYTQNTFAQARVIADTPVFSDFAKLDNFYPNSQFIYLARELSLWIPSIRQLLQRMHTNIVRDDGGFNPYIKRCYQQVFSPFTLENINDDDFLIGCYQKHQQSVKQYFGQRQGQLLTIDISKGESLNALLSFIEMPTQQGNFEKMNCGGKVTAWKDIKSPLKVESTHNGRIASLDYLATEN